MRSAIRKAGYPLFVLHMSIEVLVERVQYFMHHYVGLPNGELMSNILKQQH